MVCYWSCRRGTGLLSGVAVDSAGILWCWETGSETHIALVRCEPAAYLPTCDEIQGSQGPCVGISLLQIPRPDTWLHARNAWEFAGFRQGLLPCQ